MRGCLLQPMSCNSQRQSLLFITGAAPLRWNQHFRRSPRTLAARRPHAGDEKIESASPSAEQIPGDSNGAEGYIWRETTVIGNRADSLDSSLRTLTLSVNDPIVMADGRRRRGMRLQERWVDTYKVPGQYVPIQEAGSTSGRARLYALSSSPYAAKRDSSLLDASIVEVLVDRNNKSPEEQRLADAKPGALLQVGGVRGEGFLSVFREGRGLMEALEEGRPLLAVALGPKGIAPLRAALEWAPVQAHTGRAPVTLVYLAESPASAAYVKDWDTWREAGIRVEAVFQTNGEQSLSEARTALSPQSLECLEEVLLRGPGGLAGLLGGRLSEAAVLLAGPSSQLLAELVNRLTAAGLQRDLILLSQLLQD